jgi:hypothetical protein
VRHGLPDTRLEHVRILYEPDLDGGADPGEVVWAWVPFEEDLSQGKDRPVVIIGRAGEYLAGLALTTQGLHEDDNVFVGTGPWDAQRRDSYAKLDRILRFEPGRVRREGCVLERRRFDELIVALRRHG